MSLTYNARETNFVDVSSATISTGATNNTDTFDRLGSFSNFGVQCVWSSVVGTAADFKVQISNDGTNWDDVSGASSSTSGGAGSVTFNLVDFATNNLRVLITSASTSGNLAVRLVASGSTSRK